MSSVRKSYLIILSILLIATLLVGCAPKAEETSVPEAEDTSVDTSEEAEAEKPVIRYVFKFAESPIPPALVEYSAQRADELGVDYQQVGPQGGDIAQQVEMIESFVSAGVDVLVVSSLGPATCQAVDDAIDAGIPVIMADGDCPDSNRVTYVGSNSYDLGWAAAELYAEAVEGQGHQKILVITGTPGAQNLQEREQGFKDGLVELGVDVEFLDTIPCYEDTQQGVDAIESSLRGDPTINGIYVTAFWPFQVDAANLPLMVEKVEAGELTVVNVDALDGGLAMVDQGYIYGQISQNLGQLTVSPLEVAYQIGIEGVEYPEVCSIGYQVVTKDGGGDRFAAAEFSQMLWVDFAWDTHVTSPEDCQ